MNGIIDTFDNGLYKNLINEKIKYYASTGKPQMDFVESEIGLYKSSKEYLEKLEAMHYIQNESEIENKKRIKYERRRNKSEYKNRPGSVMILDPDNYGDEDSSVVAVEDTNAPNAKIEYPFYRKLIKQKMNYLLGKPYSFSSKNDQYLKAWNEIFDDKFRNSIKKACKEAINYGKGWTYVYYDEMGKFSIAKIQSPNTIPYWADDEHTILDAIIRFYDVTVYEGKESRTITKIEFYTTEGVYLYEVDSKGNMIKNENTAKVIPNFNITMNKRDEFGNLIYDENGNVETETKGGLWNKIPLLCIKYSDDEVGLLKLVKRMIDDYASITSSVSDTIHEMPRAGMVVKDYDGSDKSEFMKNFYENKVAFVRGTGGIESITLQTESQLTENHLNRLRKNIFELGGGVDMQNVQISNTSGVALRMIFGDLDLDCQDFADNIREFFSQLKWFIDQHLYNTTGVDYSKEKIDVEFNMDMVTNETEVIQNCINSQSMLDEKTILTNHPWVKDVYETMNAKKKEEEDKLKQFGNFGGFGQPSSDTEDSEEGNDAYNEEIEQEQQDKKKKEEEDK